MFGDDIVVRTRLIPPRPPRRWLRRARLDSLLAAAAEYPLTIVSASAGYGKSSALASFAARGGWPTAWLSLAEGADDPLVFLLHLAHACRSVVPRVGGRTIELLEQGGAQAWGQALDALINDLAQALDDETILILDDYHIADELPDLRGLVERLIAQRPPLLHLVLATRRWPQLAGIPTLQARGELLEIGEADLAFTDEEVAELFDSAYDHALGTGAIQVLSAQTGGWPIALQLIAQGTLDDERKALQTEADSSLLADSSPLSQEVLFAYLAQDVFDRQPKAIQTFLLRSAALSELDPAVCDRVLGGKTSAAELHELYRRGLFLTRLGADLYRYHPLFHAFLQERARATLADWIDLHRRAAAYYREVDSGEQVLYHLMAIGDSAGAAAELERRAPAWLASGRAVTLLAWLDQLPDTAQRDVPALLIARGDAARLLARFAPAVEAYAAAERRYAKRGDPLGEARALEGQALIYLDTVQPARAETLLRRAFKLLPHDQPADRAALLRLIAENRLNRGRADQAARLYRAAERLQTGRPATAQVDADEPRVLLRLGRLAAARALLESELPQARASLARGRPPEAHREVTLLLALVCALQGDPSAALAYAQQGLEAARRPGSALSEAVAHIRMGHVLQLVAAPEPFAANGYYLQAMALADTFDVPRTKAEAYMGMALLHGFGGDLPAAQAAAREGLAIVERSGDAWSAALLWIALGAAGAAAGAAEADEWLGQALQRYRAGKDTYGETLIQLWTSIGHQRAGRLDEAARAALQALTLARRHGYSGLLTEPTLFGPRDRMMLVPVLLAGRDDPQLGATARRWLARAFPAIAADDTIQTYHPGLTLRIQALGRLRVWRGLAEIEPRAWQRKKAQQLLALLLTNRQRWMLREQICDQLWPEDDQADAESQFKVTLNALNAALEPARPPRTPPFFIRRQGSAYRFSPSDGLWIDVAEFEAQLDTTSALLAGGEAELHAAQEALSGAVGLYQDDYLSDYLYEDWSLEERERLRARYLEAATTLAELLTRRGQLPDAMRLCEMILSRDPCWESAYVILMRAYATQGNRRQALATYDRCTRNLQTHMGLAPMPATTQLYEELKI